MKRIIPLSEPLLSGNEGIYVKECLDTNWVSYRGSFVDRFEKDLASRCGARFAVATNSGTAALHVSLLLAGVKPDTEVVMPAITFVAPGNAVRYCGAWPVFVDIQETDWQWDVAKLADFLREGCETRGGALYNRTTGRQVSALMPVHLLGDMCDVDAVAELGQRYGLPVIEDAAECLGATYKGRGLAAPVHALDPSRRFVASSFNGNKIATTGGGGVIFTDDSAMAARARHLTTTAKSGDLEFFHDELGYNYRLTNVAAAIGVAQLERLDEFIAIKRAHADLYRTAFEGQAGIAPNPESEHGRAIFWLYTILLDGPSLPVIRELNERGIGSRPIWTPLYDLPEFAGRCMTWKCEFAPRFHQLAASLPSSVGLVETDLREVAAAVLDVIRKRT
ncbi:MAG TPA: aminotransferase class I/II-fold pyridoxal phosphate-dependent enzyme [Bryobacteraceae bacterium]|nr:aminotransferase class I/II-fold pyridoxal phosphate-dependent enzyme [Bryobacteraceae bacterium]